MYLAAKTSPVDLWVTFLTTPNLPLEKEMWNIYFYKCF